MISIKNESATSLIYKIFQDGICIGKIIKEPGGKYPWRVYGHDQNKNLGSFYPKEGGKKAAIECVVNHAEETLSKKGLFNWLD